MNLSALSPFSTRNLLVLAACGIAAGCGTSLSGRLDGQRYVSPSGEIACTFANITPETVRKTLGQLLSVNDEALRKAEEKEALKGQIDTKSYRTPEQIERGIKDLERLMRESARALDFEEAAKFRDKIRELRAQLARKP